MSVKGWIVIAALAFAPESLCLAQSAVQTPVIPESCEGAAKQLAELRLRVETLERQLAAVKAPAAATPQPTAAGQDAKAREEALALYKKVDDLVAAGKLDEANRELAQWDEAHAGTPAAGWTRALNRELAVVGKAAPADWSIDHWYQGESEVQLDGKRPTLIVFWEAWCPHCKAEVPKLQKLWEDHAAEGLQVLGVTRITQTATEEMVRGFLADSGVSYPMAKETGDLATYFDVKGIPAAALVRDGKIVWRGHPVRLTEELLDSLY